MIAELFTKVINTILEWLNGKIGVITSPLTSTLDSIIVSIPALAGYKEFVKACIETFVPYRAILVVIGLNAPIYITNLTFRIIYIVKSWIPSMGGNP